MKRVFLLAIGGLGWACGAADADGGGAGGMASGVAGSAAMASAGSAGNGGVAGTSNVAGGSTSTAGVASGGNPSLAGGAGAAGSGGAAGGASGGSAGSAGSAGGGNQGCVPDANGNLSVVGETVHDAKSCLDWMKTTKTGVNYAAAETFCADATTGGFDDWHIPSASELASIVTLCGKYAPEGPIDTKVFDLQGDGYWTTTPAGEPNKVCAVGMLNAGGYYHYGTAGPQVVRCVRGAGTFEMVKDCTVAQGCSNW